MRRWLLVVLLLLVAACSKSDQERPNIVFVLVDDMNERLLPYLPRLARLMPEHGLTMHLAVPTPVCAPSRATILTGKFAHNTGVKTNGVFAGGIWAFRKGGGEKSNFAVWLQKAGYQTGFFGKYLNGYGGKDSPVPEGWSRWVSFSKITLMRYGFETSEDGGVSRAFDKIYDTDFTAGEAASWVSTAKEPFFALWTPMAPHGPFVSPKRHKHRFDDVKLTFPPSFSANKDEVEKLTRTRLEMMLSVEDGVAALIETLEKRGILDRTYIFFTSDHGLFMGEHGFPAGKGEAYDETTRVPLFVRGPGVPVGTNDALLATVDLAPTFAALAGVQAPADVDGRSFAPLLHGDDVTPPRRRALLEWFDPYGKVIWQALRTPDRKYVRYADGTCKTFRLDADPYEMNAEGCDDDFAKESSAAIDRLGSCAGAACVAAETE